MKKRKRKAGRPKTIFKYSELNEDAKERAWQWYFENRFEFFAEPVIGDAIRLAAFFGWTIDADNGVLYSGFSSQGDGACFVGNFSAEDVKPGGVKDEAPIDREIQRIAAVFEGIAKFYPRWNAGTKHTGHYCHYNSISIENVVPGPHLCDLMTWRLQGNQIDDYDEGFPGRTTEEWKVIEDRDRVFTDSFEEATRDFCRWIYKQLETDYDYQTSEPAIEESLDANDNTFNEDGESLT